MDRTFYPGGTKDRTATHSWIQFMTTSLPEYRQIKRRDDCRIRPQSTLFYCHPFLPGAPITAEQAWYISQRFCFLRALMCYVRLVDKAWHVTFTLNAHQVTLTSRGGGDEGGADTSNMGAKLPAAVRVTLLDIFKDTCGHFHSFLSCQKCFLKGELRTFTAVAVASKLAVFQRKSVHLHLWSGFQKQVF